MDHDDSTTVEFDHAYSKLHGQTRGVLLLARLFQFDQDSDWADETMEWDSDGAYPLKRGHTYVQATFLGDRQIPFTTYREPTARNLAKYMGREGRMFSFHIPSDGTGQND